MDEMIGDLADMVRQFNTEILDITIPEIPTRLSDARKDFGIILLDEEVLEFSVATTLEDEVDALVDLTYVALGRLLEMGVAPRAVFEEVHRANMRKKRGVKSTRPNSLGCDAYKPEGWVGPDHTPYLTVTRDQLAKALKLSSCLGCADAVCDDCDDQKFDNFTEHRRTKFLIIGHARHGKDTVAEIMRDNIGMSFTSSSEFLAKEVIYPVLDTQYGYTCWEDCFEDRFNHRAEWFNLIREYNTPDNTRLARAIMAKHDIYCGMRSDEELLACKEAGIFDAIIWVYRPDTNPEDFSSCTVRPDMATHYLVNDGDFAKLASDVDTLVSEICK